MTWQLDPTHTRIEFSARHMLVSRVRGVFDSYQLEAKIDESDLSKSSATLTIDAASVDTGVEDRDAHLKSGDFFDVENHPKIVFETKRIEPKGDGEYRVVGNLTIRDETREVEFKGEAHGPAEDPWGGKRIALTAEAQVNRKDFGLTWNVPLAEGALVSDKVTLSIEAELVPAA
ncbi:MAG: YceI family protein [Dehalococcoidia bacterium]|nr:YceI family protein [Dehalococcoidia bacterium]